MIQEAQRVAETYAIACGTSILAGIAIDDVNKYLQAGAFVVAMVSGACAAYYYIKKARRL